MMSDRPSEGLIVPPGCVIVFDRPLRPLNPAERHDQREQLARAAALRRTPPRPNGLHLVARIDEWGRDIVPAQGRDVVPAPRACAVPLRRGA